MVIFENISNHGGQFKRMVEVSYLNNVHQNVWFKPPRYGYSYPEVNLKRFYGWDGGGVLFEQCFWYKKICINDEFENGIGKGWYSLSGTTFFLSC